MKVIRILAWLLISFSWCPAQPEYPRILENLPANTVKSFTGANALFHLAAVAATGLLIFTDADYRVHAFFYRHPGADNWFFPVAVAGGLGPVVTGSWFYFSGKHASCPRLAGVGCAVLQASLINITYVSLLKAVTGRPNPDREKYDNMQELSRTFRFGFGRGGIFWGWPSGHTSASLAVLSCLTAYYPEKTWLKAGSAVWMVYTMAGVCAIGDGHMHWLSDAVAGSLVGYAIGSTVGKYYRGKQAATVPGSAAGLGWEPVLRPYGSGGKLVIRF